MSRKGDCYDNAPMESFWGTLKNELIHHCRYKTREQAIREMHRVYRVFYNRQRRQARPGYLSRLSMNGSSMQGRLQHLKESFVSTIDIRGHTYIPTEEGWLWQGIRTSFHGRNRRNAMSSRITKTLVSQSLFRAVAADQIGLIHHSDSLGGRQYCAHEYQRLMEQFKMRASMSRKGDCYDNAPMESFLGYLKNELIHHCRYKTKTNRPSGRSPSISRYFTIGKEGKRGWGLSRL